MYAEVISCIIGMAIFEILIAFIYNNTFRNSKEKPNCIRYHKFLYIICIMLSIMASGILIIGSLCSLGVIKDIGIEWSNLLYIIPSRIIVISFLLIFVMSKFKLYVFDDHIIKSNICHDLNIVFFLLILYFMYSPSFKTYSPTIYIEQRGKFYFFKIYL